MRDFAKTKRIVIKVGTHVLSKDSAIDTDFLCVIARQIAALVTEGRQVILVSSGAIGMGAGALGITHKIGEVKKRQACAAIGQGILMYQYRQAFARHGQEVAQILLTNTIMNNRKYYVNLKNTMETLLQMGIVPIVNENDCVSIDEIGLAFGDNDLLSALVASKIDAELLIILTDVKGLYNKNPRTHAAVQLIPAVYGITPEIEAMAGKTGSAFATGGMTSKINAIKVAADAGCKAILAHGRDKNILQNIIKGREIGTLFLPKRRISNRKRWILNCQTDARIDIDPGAEKAIKNSRSLLTVGIIATQGAFDQGDVVQIGNVAKGVTDVSSTELTRLLKTKDTAPTRKAIIHANNIVFLNQP